MSPDIISNWPQKILVANPRGFCAGVVRAVDALDSAVKNSQGDPVSSFHEIIHNNHVVGDFKQRGVRFVKSIDDVPEESILLISAHGASPATFNLAEQRRIRVIDATCPLVIKTHTEAKKFLAEGRTVLYIGHANHDETVGTLGQAPQVKLIEKAEDVDEVEVEDPEKVALVMQTTLSMDDSKKIREAISKRLPHIVQPRTEDVCFATQNRQNGVKLLISQGAGAVIVVGSPTSSNSTRLAEVTEQNGAKPFFVDDVSGLKPEYFGGFDIVGLTSGASVPEEKLQEVLRFFTDRGSRVYDVNVPNTNEDFGFQLPRGLDKL